MTSGPGRSGRRRGPSRMRFLVLVRVGVDVPGVAVGVDVPGVTVPVSVTAGVTVGVPTRGASA